MINILSINTNHVDYVTKVKLEIYESLGTMQRLKDTLELSLAGILKYGEELDEAIEQELKRNNYDYYDGDN